MWSVIYTLRVLLRFEFSRDHWRIRRSYVCFFLTSIDSFCYFTRKSINVSGSFTSYFILKLYIGTFKNKICDILRTSIFTRPLED